MVAPPLGKIEYVLHQSICYCLCHSGDFTSPPKRIYRFATVDRELEVYIKNGVLIVESHKLDEGLILGKVLVSQNEGNSLEDGNMLMLGFNETQASTIKHGSMSFTKMMLDIHYDMGNTCISGGDEDDRKRFIDLDEDLFQQANADDNVDDAENEEEDYIDMVDELQQGNEDVVFDNIDLENTDVLLRYNAQEVDEEVVDREEHVVDDTSEPKTVDEIDESEFEQ
uniref:Uncharacterized protein n=1 Tax=Tanacetum cinerariifolium TaxID=118510 RepID=A0A6L2LTL6_TANCI|nr:hypothetical protein [Tanacetum cinerariifolium]